MDQRDRPIKASDVLYVRLPSELLYLCKQSARRSKQTLTQTVRNLLETHPAIAYEAEVLYDKVSNQPTGEDSPE